MFPGCEIADGLEQYHFNPLKNLRKRRDLSENEKILIANKRKMVSLCKKHYMLLHKKGITKREKKKKTYIVI